MGVGRKSHGKKSDKETQSPVLKIFKDIMQKENTDPEKVTLLKDKQRNKKKKSYSESRSKSEQLQKSYDSSSTDRYKSRQTKITVQDIQEDRDEEFNDRSRSQAFQNEKRESWWLWGDPQKKKKEEDTCSCVSCALKKIISSEYTCIACLFLLFSISVVIIFIMVFKMPDTGTCDNKKALAIKEKRQLTESYGYPVYTERNKWENEITSHLNYAGDMGSEYANDGIKGSNILDNLESGLSGDLAHILENEKILEGQNSDRLRDFFKKLIQTDSQIRKLKQAINYNYKNDKYFTERFKRSLKNRLKFFHQSKKDSNTESIHIPSKTHININNTKQKRSPNCNNITGFIIKKEKILIKYEPDKPNFPKCSHNHELKSHEKKLKHTFHKNNQMTINQKSDNNAFNKVLIAEENKGKAKTKANDVKKEFTVLDYKVYDDNAYNKLETKLETATSDNINEMRNLDYDMNNLLSTTPTYDVTLTVSTFINPLNTPESKTTKPEHRPGHRQLMQIDEEKEEISYEDLKEVLNDDQQDRDDTDRQVERKKRDSEQGLDILKYQNPYSTSNPSNIHNPNWKGPMPLYPDELNAMIKQAALQNVNMQVPVNTKDTKVEKDRDEKEISDKEYIEDYIDNKYNKMVKMAQAYSDYGVVYGKNDNNNNIKDKSNGQDQKLKFIFDKQKFVDRFFRKPDKVMVKDVKKYETVLDHAPDEQNEFIKILGKHVKILKNPNRYQNTLLFNNLEHKQVYTPNHISLPLDINTDTMTSDKNTANDYKLKRVLRSLKSIEIDEKPDVIPFNSIDNNSKSNLTSGIVDFLSLMSDWFSTLAGLSGEKESDSFKNVIGNGSHGYFRSNATGITRNRTLKDIDFSYPSYDLDMVDNINHKSRVLMSVKDNNDFNENSVKNVNASVSDAEKINSTDFEDSMTLALVLAENIGNLSKENKSRTVKIENDDENKTIVKRSPDNKVFWNDLYDSDEYGVPIDYLDGARNKHSINRNAIQESKDWLKNHFDNINRKIKDKFRKNKGVPKKTKTTKCDECTRKTIKKRPVRQSDNNEDNDIKKTFAMLTANMKKVCQKAARDLESSRHIGVREENKEDTAATSLMQQLVRLMADLVDIQVQQKTCAKLPSDLHDFLEWLTVPTDDNVEVDNLDMNSGISDYVTPVDYLSRYGKSTNPTLDLPTYNEDTHQDDRTECLGIIQSVQDLIQRYEEMTDEDKSKMTGIREYLENQLEFLNRKLSVVSENNLYKIYDKRQIRNRRDVWNNKNHRHEGINKFIKTFGKKHTKSTLNTYDGVTVTKTKNLKNKNSFKNVGVANVLKYTNN